MILRPAKKKNPEIADTNEEKEDEELEFQQTIKKRKLTKEQIRKKIEKLNDKKMLQELDRFFPEGWGYDCYEIPVM